MELIRLEFQSFRDFAETAWPGLGRDGLWAPPGAPLPEGLEEVRLEVGLVEGSPLLRGIVRLEPEAESGRTFLRFVELDRPSRVLLDRIEAKLGRAITAGPRGREGRAMDAGGREGEPQRPTTREGLAGPAVGDEEAGAASASETVGTSSWVAEGMPARPAPPGAGTDLPPGSVASPAEAHTLEELADLLSREDRAAALAQTQRVVSAPRPAPPAEVPAQSVAHPDPAPLPPYLGGPDPRRPARKVVVVRSPWLWIAVAVGLLAGAWGLGRMLRQGGDAAEGALGSTAAARGAGERREQASPSFDRVERIDSETGEDSTVVTVRVNGSIPRDRWSIERVEVGATREILTLRGVGVLPEPNSVEVGDERITRLRAGLHRGPDGDSLQVVADLADGGVRLAGVDVRERALRLVFVTG
jgi:hypothetical protein